MASTDREETPLNHPNPYGDTHLSSIQHLLRTNDPPPESEATRLREGILAEKMKRLYYVEEALFRLRASGTEMLRERDELVTSIILHRGVLSPIRCLPNEIIAEILLYTPTMWRYEALSGSAEPWQLTRICSRWRSIAIGLPSLWSSLSVGDYKKTPVTKDPLMLLETALARGGNHKLDVRFECEHFPLHIQEELLTALMRHSSRWNAVSLSIPHDLLAMLTPVQGTLHCLKELSLQVPIEAEFPQPELPGTFDLAPFLHTVSLRGITIPDPSRLPCSQLTKLSAHDVRAENHIAIISRAPNLTSFNASCKTGYLPTPTVTVHTSLRDLFVCGGQLFGNLQLPALEDLSIEPEAILTRCEMGPLASLLLRSGCSLRSLSLSDVDMEPDELIEALQAAPTLITLSFEISAFTADDDDCLEAVVSRSLRFDADQESPLLPRLEELYINILEDADYLKTYIRFVNTSFAEMVASRWWLDDASSRAIPTSRLQILHVSVYSKCKAWLALDDKDIASLKRIEEDGMEIDISAGGEFIISRLSSMILSLMYILL